MGGNLKDTPGKSYSRPLGYKYPLLPPHLVFFFSSFFISPHPHSTKNISSNISSIPYLLSGPSSSTGVFRHQIKPYYFSHLSTSISGEMKPTVTMRLRHWPSSRPHASRPHASRPHASRPHASHVRLVMPPTSDFVPSLH